MITEKSLFTQGWKRFGDEENDSYYKIILYPKVFGLGYLSGNFTEEGSFEIYGIQNRFFKTIFEIKELFKINKFEINYKIMENYGSKEPKIK